MTVKPFSPNAIQTRDEALLRYLSAVTVMSRQQIARLLWYDTTEEIARKRLDKLMNRYGLIQNFHRSKAEMEARGLTYRRVYTLTDAGRAWLADKLHADPGRLVKPRQVIHDLLVAETMTRFAEATRALGESFHFNWHSERATSFYAFRGDRIPRLMPDGLAEIRGNKTHRAYFIEVDASREGHVRPSSRIGKKISGYDLLLKKPKRKASALEHITVFPTVLFITHGEKRLLNIAESIRKLRQQSSIVYALALFDDLFAADDFLSAKVWLRVGNNTLKRVSLKVLGDVTPEKEEASPASPPKKSVALKKPPVPQKKSEIVQPLPPSPAKPKLPANLLPVFPPVASRPKTRLRPFRRQPNLSTLLYRQFLNAVKKRGKGYDLGWLAPPTVAVQVWQNHFPSLSPPLAMAILRTPTSGIEAANAYFINVVTPDIDWQTKTQAYHYLRQTFQPAYTAGLALATLPQFILLLNAPSISVEKVLRPLYDASPPIGLHSALLSDFLAAPDVFTDPIFIHTIIYNHLTLSLLKRTSFFSV